MTVTVTAIVTTDYPEMAHHVLSNGQTVLVDTDRLLYSFPFITRHPQYIAAYERALTASHTVMRLDAILGDYSKPLDFSPAGQGYRAGLRTLRSRRLRQAVEAMAKY